MFYAVLYWFLEAKPHSQVAPLIQTYLQYGVRNAQTTVLKLKTSEMLDQPWNQVDSQKEAVVHGFPKGADSNDENNSGNTMSKPWVDIRSWTGDNP